MGLVGSGKTTQALRDIEGIRRSVVFAPTFSNPGLFQIPYVYDDPRYFVEANGAARIETYLKMHGRLLVLKKQWPSPVFKILSQLRNCAVLLDDVAALTTAREEKGDFESLVRTIRHYGNRLILTTHRANRDLPRLVQTVGTSFYYVGPSSQDEREIKTLYNLVNYPISLDEFTERLVTNPKYKTFCVRRSD